jgi:hypothetical protein
MRTMWLVIVLAAGCGSKHPNQCPDNHTKMCVNGDVCSFERRRGCQVCECRPFDQNPSGRDPDDPHPPGT